MFLFLQQLLHISRDLTCTLKCNSLHFASYSARVFWPLCYPCLHQNLIRCHEAYAEDKALWERKIFFFLRSLASGILPLGASKRYQISVFPEHSGIARLCSAIHIPFCPSWTFKYALIFTQDSMVELCVKQAEQSRSFLHYVCRLNAWNQSSSDFRDFFFIF